MKISCNQVVVKHLFHIAAFVLLMFSSVAFSEEANETDTGTATNAESILSSYKINIGDKIRIQVFGEADLSLDSVKLSDAGTISYPFIGEIPIQGLTTSEIQQLITSKLKGDYLIDPKVTVSVLQYREYYLYGEVNGTGSYPYAPGMTVRKAVTIAGGFSPYADKDEIKIIREFSEEKKELTVGADAIVLPGDVINVEDTFF